MLEISGQNKFSQLNEESNNKNMNGDPIICPPISTEIVSSAISCYSTYDDHTIVITKEGEILMVGNNKGKQINHQLPSGIIKTYTKFEITKENRTFYPLSAVCGSNYTLYLVCESKESVSKKFLYLTSKNYRKSLFLNIGDSNPVSLFGGHSHSASIDDKGMIIFINDTKVEINSLPDNDKATCISFCSNHIFVVGSNSRVYVSEINKSVTKLNFKIVKELEGKNIVDVNGTFNHCFAVSKEGKVFGYGSNQYGELGMKLEDTTIDVNEFTEVLSLNKYKIKNAYAGFDHSLFRTENGKILACGSNYSGQLLNKEQSEEFFYLPIETDIQSEATFCVAGFGCSSVFINYDPLNSPNRRLVNKKVTIQVDKDLTESKLKQALEKLNKAEEELKRLKEENSKLKDENGLLLEKVKKLESKTENVQKQNQKSNSFQLEIFEPTAIDSLKVVKTIGRGESSEVFEVSREQHHALKVLFVPNDSNDSDSMNQLKHFQQECQNIMALNHPNIIQIFGFCFGDSNHAPSILLQFCSHNLRDSVNEMKDFERVCVIYEICIAMEAIHKLNLIHRNLKPENILIDEQKHVRLTDFGTSILFSDQKQSKKIDVSSLVYMAPELLTSNTNYNNKVDVYSFGVVVYFIITGGKIPKINANEIINPKKFIFPINFNKIARDLISHCWFTSPRERPSFMQIVSFIKSNKFKLIDGVEKNFLEINKFLSI